MENFVRASKPEVSKLKAGIQIIQKDTKDTKDAKDAKDTKYAKDTKDTKDTNNLPAPAKFGERKTLYEQLQENEAYLDAKFNEECALQNSIYRLHDDDLNYLEKLKQEKNISLKALKEAEEKGLAEFKNAQIVKTLEPSSEDISNILLKKRKVSKTYRIEKKSTKKKIIKKVDKQLISSLSSDVKTDSLLVNYDSESSE